MPLLPIGRGALNLTPEDLAGVIGVNRRVVSELERGRGTVWLEVALEAASRAALGCRFATAQLAGELIVSLVGDRADTRLGASTQGGMPCTAGSSGWGSEPGLRAVDVSERKGCERKRKGSVGR
jgi:transcriptional regulator with XRE-family HTH domain